VPATWPPMAAEMLPESLEISAQAVEIGAQQPIRLAFLPRVASGE